MTTTRREFLIGGAVMGAGVLLQLPSALGRPRMRPLHSTLPGGDIPMYQTPLLIPPAMPLTERIRLANGRQIDRYDIAVRQMRQQVLPAPLPRTTVWGYGSSTYPETFSSPSLTIEARWRQGVRVRWINELVDRKTGHFRPHLLPVDPTVHWANPPGGREGRDGHSHVEETPGPYLGPVPTVVHVHGAETQQESDGYAEAWYLPDASDIPEGYARNGTFYRPFRKSSSLGDSWSRGSAVFEYPNRQRATTLWYHDHTLGITRLNVYAGLAGFFLLRGGPDDEVDGVLPGPAPQRGEATGTEHFEIPIVIQDRAFDDDGSLWYPESREYFDGFAGPYIPHSDISPIWNPEFFGDVMMVNGRTWPYLETQQRRYRLRLLNGCNSRFLMLKFDNDLPFWILGTEGGFLPQPLQQTRLLLGPAERADVIVDFTNVPVGTELILQNLAPDEPFGGGEPGVDFEPADPETTGQVMQFRIVSSSTVDPSSHPGDLALPAIGSIPDPDNVRGVSLGEEMSKVIEGAGPAEAVLGTLDENGQPVRQDWDHPITEFPTAGSTERWEIHNFTVDAHPIHLHATQFRVVERQPFDDGTVRAAEAWEAGFKDTVVAYPGEITRISARFKIAGRFVWHCHILEHEDNEMMRPFEVV